MTLRRLDCCHVPIVETIPVSVDASDEVRLERIAGEYLRREPALAATPGAGSVRAGALETPALVIDEHGGIALFDTRGGAHLEYRMLFLAGEGDLFALSAPRHEHFEHYCAETLQLGRLEVSSAGAGPQGSLAQRIRGSAPLMRRVASLAHESGGLTILSYIGSRAAWDLASDIASRGGVPVAVASSPPELTRRINDKLWFLRNVEAVLGRRSLPATRSAFGPAALTAHVSALAQDHERVALKLPDSAGSVGNFVFESASLRDLGGARALRDYLLGVLHDLGWGGRFPLAVEVWEAPVLLSPSVQVWIPSLAQGPPLVEGIFEQIVEGPAGEFVGAEPLELPPGWKSRLATEAVLLARLMQYLGCYGRVSLDAIIIGESLDARAGTELHWVECNGRWGGTAIPLSLVNRLSEGPQTPPFVVVQKATRGARRIDFEAALEAIGDRLYVPGRESGGVIPLSPTRLELGTGIDFVVIGSTRQRAREEAARLASAFGRAQRDVG